MCGFVAVIGPPSVSESQIRFMRDRLVHRGPDDAGLLVKHVGSNIIGFGFRRLAIQDLSHFAHQPMIVAGGSVSIVFNGEIYNFIELRHQLEALGHSFLSDSDTEVLAKSYLQWGQACVERLNGQFSFAIWDEREQAVFVARDRFGEKPLYYANIPGGGLIIASEMKAILAHPLVPVKANQKKLSEYAHGIADYGADQTTFEGITQFRAAHQMVIQPNGHIRSYRRFWTPETAEMQSGRSNADLIDEFEYRLRKSISLRMRSDVAVGACLSGGLDSSGLTALMAEESGHHRHQLKHTVSARFDNDPTIDEGYYIDAVLRHVSSQGYSCEISPSDLISASADLHWHQEAPLMSASAYLEWKVHQTARKSGVTVMIDGQGADEVLAGYSYYFPVRQNDWMNTGAWSTLAWNTWLMSYRLARESTKYHKSDRRFSAQAGKPVAHWCRLGIQNKVNKIKGKPLLEQPSDTGEPGVPSPMDGNYLRSYIARGLLYASMPNQLVVADRNSMASGVEARFPYLDHEFVDWCLTLPPELLIRDGWQKWILRKAVSKRLPKQVAWRADKVGFQAPQDNWLRGSLKDWAYERIFEGPATELEEYNRAEIEHIWEKHQCGEDLSWSLWIWASMSEWLDLQKENRWKGAPNTDAGCHTSALS